MYQREQAGETSDTSAQSRPADLLTLALRCVRDDRPHSTEVRAKWAWTTVAGSEHGPGRARRLRHLADMTQHGMPGGKGPALTTEAVGDPYASSERVPPRAARLRVRSSGRRSPDPSGRPSAPRWAVSRGAAAGPDEPAKRPGDGRVDSREDRKAAYESAPAASPRGVAPAMPDARREEHAADIPVVDALTGHGEAEAERAPRRRRAANGHE